MKQEIYNFVKDCGCCEFCCLRFLKARGNEYDDFEESFTKLGVKQQPVEKRRKENPCVACLGLFSSEIISQILQETAEHSELKKYECDKFIVALSFPLILQVRQFSLWLALRRKFDSVVSDSKSPDVPLKEAAKLIINPKLGIKLNKQYDQNGIMINIALHHPDEAAEMKELHKFSKLFLRDSSINSHKRHKSELTRGFIERYFIPNNVCIETYAKHLPIPPEISNSPLVLQNITIVGPTVFVAGRYRKLSRKLSHSPWVLQGKRVMEESIEEIIVETIAPYYGVTKENVIFSSSGREDVDVRCLGKGRPFVLEISNAKRIILPKDVAGNMEIDIEKSEKISVQHLQMVDRSEISHLKTGEEQKRKFYRAMCILKENATPEIMKKLNIPEEFQIIQITPIRVMHRRPLHARPRKIYSVKAAVDKNNSKIVILDIVTQAGTYVKELIHSDFGRTNPSISSIIGQWIDIIALDVMAIDLDWPKEINNR